MRLNYNRRISCKIKFSQPELIDSFFFMTCLGRRRVTPAYGMNDLKVPNKNVRDFDTSTYNSSRAAYLSDTRWRFR